MKIGVVGAGIIGTSIAYHLGKAGAQVTVFDIGSPGNGVSSTCFACLNAFGQPEPDLQFRLDAIRYHSTIAREVGSEQLLHVTGTLRFASSDNGAARLAERAKCIGENGSLAQHLTASSAGELAPLVNTHLATDCVFIPEEGWIEAKTLCEHLARVSERRFSVEFRRERILAIGANATQVLVVSHLMGTAAFDRLVLAVGNETNALLTSAGMSPVPLTTEPGPLVELSFPKSDETQRHVIYADNLHIKAGDHGGFLAGVAPATDAAPLYERLEKERLDLIGAGRRWLRRFDEMHGKWMVGARPMPSDGLPILGKHDECPTIHIAVMHGGVTLGPLVGRLLADEMVNGRTDPRLGRYAYVRFSKAAVRSVAGVLGQRIPSADVAN
ncbi:NAD(P)/FAD-dependent oxidoreductase [Bradyrhizobium cenepequi]|uniref:NAD(P)/FAD-dependent oxidoreductase n=1 Tax=Bradyrhizobium cenepequi TaxID=2821403 RepID=UPI001CE2D528|nr:FAD-binding oxidoreductase [Bradyrhizobium cenepequi]MCA6107921.1 FAD-binding oxidoreductase [Bradyrhizobium cenepequi]